MARKKALKQTVPMAGISMKGFYRVNIVNPDGSIAGDSGWHENIIVSSGITNYLTYVFASSAGSLVISKAALGSLSSVASDLTASTIMPGSYATSLATTVSRSFTTRAASNAGDTCRYYATWVSGTSTATIAAVGLYAAATDKLFCIGSFASSTVASNQAVNLSYDIVFLASAS